RRQRGRAAELALEEGDRRLVRPGVHPGEQPEGEHVLRALGVLLGDVEVGQSADGHRGQRDRVHHPTVECAVLERVAVVADLGQVALGELIGVDDDVRATGYVGKVRLEGGRVHRYEHVRCVTRGEDVVVSEVDLKAGDTGEGAGGRPYFGGEVRQRRDVVAE